MKRRAAIPNYNSEAGAAFIFYTKNLFMLTQGNIRKSNQVEYILKLNFFYFQVYCLFPPSCTFEGLFRTGSALIYARFPDPKEAKCGFVPCKNL